MDVHQPYEDRPAGGSLLQPGMAFLAESPEAFGLVPDACPVVTDGLLIAASGHGAEGGATSPVYTAEEGGVDGLLETVYRDLIAPTEENRSLLHHTFGNGEGRQEHAVARYAAVLAEATALRVFRGAAQGASFDQSCTLLGQELGRALAVLRARIGEDSGRSSASEAVFYTVSFGACRLTDMGGGDYALELFAAGDYRVFLLDGQGMSPLWLADTPVRAAGTTTPLTGKHLCLHHPEPFAVLLLSDGVCAIDAAEHRSLRASPGLVWRYRMRLEDYFLRLLNACVREQEFGERAARFFIGRAHGHDSASGALIIQCGDASYEVFRAACRSRLGELEAQIALLPNGYDPAHVVVPDTRVHTEQSYLARLLEHEAGLSDRVTEALRLCALEKLRSGEPTDPLPPPDAPEYTRLSFSVVWEVYRRYDVENDEDRARIVANRRALRDGFADHWVTLRPLLATLPGLSTADFPEAMAYRARCDRDWVSCTELNVRLGEQLAARRQSLARIEQRLTDSLTVLRTECTDWLCGRAADEQTAAWARELAAVLPAELDCFIAGRAAGTDRYRSLLTAYTAERDALFQRDTTAPYGFFAADWQAILDGTLSDNRWEAICAAPRATSLVEMSLSGASSDPSHTRETPADASLASYAELLQALRHISDGTGTLLSRVDARAADRRMARDLANRSEWQLACLRASAYEDTDWGADVLGVMNTALRNDYHAMIRHYLETCEQLANQAAAYASYRAMYERYMAIGT